MTIRAYRAADRDAVVATVREVYDEYGFAWDEAGYCADLYDIPANYRDGWFWVVDGPAGVVGCVGLSVHDPIDGGAGDTTVRAGIPRAAGSDCELHRLYVRPSARGHGLGKRLAETVIGAARAQGATHLEIWSDKKLSHAHKLYESLGARPVGERICPGDPDESPEWGFILAL